MHQLLQLQIIGFLADLITLLSSTAYMMQTVGRRYLKNAFVSINLAYPEERVVMLKSLNVSGTWSKSHLPGWQDLGSQSHLRTILENLIQRNTYLCSLVI